MKKLTLALLFCAAAFMPQSYAALPSLSELATSITTLRERLAAATNETAELRARLANLTNLTARLEAVANSTRDMRRTFHGGAPASRFETNLVSRIIQRVDVYPDGYEYVQGGGTRYYTPEEMAALIAARKKNNPQSRIDVLRRSIAELEAMSQSTNRLEAAQAYIALCAAQNQLARLEATATTNTVNVTVTPQGN